MSGWVSPSAPAPTPGPGPLVGWVAPDEPAGLSVGEIIRGGWRLAMSNLGQLAAITAVPVLIVQLLLIPFWSSFGASYQRMFEFYLTADWQRYAGDPEGLQRDLQAVMQQTDQLASVIVIAGGVSFVIGMLGAAALAAATLDAAAGRRPSIGSAFGAVARRVRTVVVPALVLGAGYVLVLIPISLQGSFSYSSGGTGQAGLAALLSLVLLVVEIAAFYLAIRWAPYFQVVIAEAVGLRAGLRRSAEITQGIRLRLALALIAMGIAFGLVFSLAGLVVGIVAGVAAGSFLAGIVGWTLVLALSGLLYFPVFAGSLTHVYRVRSEVLRERGAQPSTPSAPGPVTPDAGRDATPDAEPPTAEDDGPPAGPSA